MVRFAGNHVLTLDDKDRVVLPLGLRKCIDDKDRDAFLEKGFMIRPGDTNEFLELYPTQVYDDYIRWLESRYAPEDEEAQGYLRFFTSRVEPVELDRQYRFNLSTTCQRAVGVEEKKPGVEREVVFVGRTTKVEIWPRQRWVGWETGNPQRKVPAASQKGPPVPTFLVKDGEG